MKKIISLLAFVMLFTDKTAFADPSKVASLTIEQKREIAWAIRVLAETKVVSRDQNMCAQFDQDIIEELFRLGLLNKGESIMRSICIGTYTK